MQKFQSGEKATWLYVPRGGYGYIYPVPVTVVGYTKAGKVLVDALLKDGTTTKRYVQEESLVAQTEIEAEAK